MRFAVCISHDERDCSRLSRSRISSRIETIKLLGDRKAALVTRIGVDQSSRCLCFRFLFYCDLSFSNAAFCQRVTINVRDGLCNGIGACWHSLQIPGVNVPGFYAFSVGFQSCIGSPRFLLFHSNSESGNLIRGNAFKRLRHRQIFRIAGVGERGGGRSIFTDRAGVSGLCRREVVYRIFGNSIIHARRQSLDSRRFAMLKRD